MCDVVVVHLKPSYLQPGSTIRRLPLGTSAKTKLRWQYTNLATSMTSAVSYELVMAEYDDGQRGVLACTWEEAPNCRLQRSLVARSNALSSPVHK